MRDNLNIISNMVEMKIDLLDNHHYFTNYNTTFHISLRIYSAPILKKFPTMAPNYGFEKLENSSLGHMHKIMTLFSSISSMLDTHAKTSAIFLYWPLIFKHFILIE